MSIHLSTPTVPRRFPWAGPVVLILAAVMWGLSIALPVWETRSENGEWRVVRGYLPALIGFLGILVWCPAWLANILLIPLATKMLTKSSGQFVLSVAAFAIALSAHLSNRRQPLDLPSKDWLGVSWRAHWSDLRASRTTRHADEVYDSEFRDLLERNVAC